MLGSPGAGSTQVVLGQEGGFGGVSYPPPHLPAEGWHCAEDGVGAGRVCAEVKSLVQLAAGDKRTWQGEGQGAWWPHILYGSCRTCKMFGV